VHIIRLPTCFLFSLRERNEGFFKNCFGFFSQNAPKESSFGAELCITLLELYELHCYQSEPVAKGGGYQTEAAFSSDHTNTERKMFSQSTLFADLISKVAFSISCSTLL